MEFFALEVGGIFLYAYGLILLAAALSGIFAAWGNARLQGEEFYRVEEMLLWGLPLSIVGGRAVYVLFHWSEYGMAPLSVLCIWQGGISPWGGLAVFFFTLSAYSQIHGFDVWRWLDILAPSLLLVAAVYEMGILALQWHGIPQLEGVMREQPLAEYVEFYFQPMWAGEPPSAAVTRVALQFAVFLSVSLTVLWQRQRRAPWQHGCIALLGIGSLALVRVLCGFFSPSEDVLSSGRLLFGGTAFLCLGLFAWRSRQGDPIFYG